MYINQIWFQLSDGFRNWLNSNIKDDYPESALKYIQNAFRKAGFADTDIDISLEREFTLHYHNEMKPIDSEYIDISYTLRGYIYDSPENKGLNPKPIFDKAFDYLHKKRILDYQYFICSLPIQIANIPNVILKEGNNLTIVSDYYCLPNELESIKESMQTIAQYLTIEPFAKIKYFGNKIQPTPLEKSGGFYYYNFHN